MNRSPAPIRVLHVDDDPGFAEMVATFLEREDDRLAVESASSASEGLERLADDIDCIVSDYDMPGTSGIEFLKTVRETDPELPFILFTGKGSEAVASDAISAGVTDYLQKEASTCQYTVLANRIGNAVDQYRSRTALEASQERLSLFIEQSSLGVIEWDENFDVVRLNDAAERILGYSEAELKGQSWEAIVPPADREEVDQVVSRLLRTEGGYHSVNRNVRADGEQVICEWHNRVITDDAGDVVAVFSQFQDVTESERRKEALERQNDLFTKAQDIADVGAWEHDVRRSRDLWTDQVYDIYDLPKDVDPTPERRFECYHPEDRPTVREAFERAVEEGESYELELRLLVDDERRWVQTRGDPQTEDGTCRVRGTVQDITDLKQRERQFESLHEASRELMRAKSRTDVARITIDAAKNILGYIRAAVRFVDEDEEVLRTFATTERNVAAAGERPDYRVDENTPASRTYRHGEPEIHDDLGATDDEYDRGSLRSGLYVPIGEHGVFSCGEARRGAFDETDVDLIAVLTKLSAAALTRIRSTQRLRDQNERLKEFVSVVSHDLRTPLSVAKGRLELARRECDSDHLDHVADALARSDTLVDDFLARARDGAGTTAVEPCDLAEAVEACWRNVETSDATLVTATDRVVVADPDRLQRLLENLVRNAVEHGGDDVTVVVGGLDDGFYVEDDGRGIPEADRRTVLESGYSTANDGTGVGLHIVDRMADVHDWALRVTESDDGGARFEITGVEFVSG